MNLSPQEAQARVDEARALLRAAERERDAAFAAWYAEQLAHEGRAHGLYARLAREAGLSVELRQSVINAVKRGRAASPSR